MKQILGLVFFTFVLIILSQFTGPVEIQINDLFQKNKNALSIFWDIRFFRTLAAFSVGACLGLAGLLAQTLFRNPLAEPYTLGLSGGASLGAVTTIALGFGSHPILMTTGTFVGCWLATFVILGLGIGTRHQIEEKTILSGVMLSFFCGSLITLFITWLEPQKLQSALFWMIGQIGTERDSYSPATFVVAVTMMIALTYSHRNLDRFLLHSDFSISMGLDLKKSVILIIFAITLLTSVSVTVAGLIGFVGLVSPHISYFLLKSSRHKYRVVLTGLIGGCFFLVADITARKLGGINEIPSGSFCALFGAPYLIWLLSKRRGFA